MPVRISSVEGINTVIIENDCISAVFIPSIGSKMIQLVNKETGTQFLLEPQEDDKKYSVPSYGEEFSDKYAYGFDDCFPTVSSTIKDINVRGGGFPDHGELWSLPWDYWINDKKIVFKISGVIAQYSIVKVVSLDGNRLIINYSLQNLSNEKVDYLWSAHPLLKVASGDQIILPKESKELIPNISPDDKTCKLKEILTWPFIDKNEKKIDYSKVPDVTFGQAIKCFTGRLKSGYAGLHRVNCDETILFSFNTDELKYLGLWLCYGGWPEDSPNKHLTVALEPTSGRPDSLVEAVKRNEAECISPLETKNWNLEISLWKGIPDKLL
ncbi:MAG: hypothetical protein Q7S39_09240 [Ignavibacteria bacterium]|nr:hypothetical protein [Ignavibacteria bacterium]